MKKIFSLLLALAALAFCSCDKNLNNEEPYIRGGGIVDRIISKTVLKGRAQKGPYIIGSTVTIMELDSALDQTGRTYITTIVDKFGNFEQKNLKLSTPIVQIKADGYYFNEVLGKVTSSPITLHAIADVTDRDSLNINILTTLESPRTLYLAQHDSLPFAAAKARARREVLAVFGRGSETEAKTAAEDLDLLDNASLLAISAIVQGRKKANEVSELIALFSDDLREDGTIDNPEVGSRLMYNAMALIPGNIIHFLTERYGKMNCTTDDIKSIINAFVANCPFEATETIYYPANGKFGQNILADDGVTTYEVCDLRSPGYSIFYSLAVETPSDAPVKVVISSKESEWYRDIASYQNWTVGQRDYNPTTNRYEQTFTVTNPGEPSDILVTFDHIKNGNFLMEIYEYDSPIPTRIKTISTYSDYPR